MVTLVLTLYFSLFLGNVLAFTSVYMHIVIVDEYVEEWVYYGYSLAVDYALAASVGVCRICT